jgi:hypothetical protein
LPPSAPDHSVSFRFKNHLGFGVRVEGLSMLVDGSPTLVDAAGSSAGPAGDRVPMQPGVHSVAVTFRATEPCGLSEEPRASVIVHAATTFSVGDRPGAVLVDLFAREATRDPMQALAVRFTGAAVVLGVSADALRAPPGCGADDAVCALDAKASLARARRDASRASCYETRRPEAVDLRDVVLASYAAVRREGVTSGDAQTAQLRARYAGARLRSIAVEAEACATEAGRLPATAATVEREVERSCPIPDVTAELGGFFARPGKTQ